MARTRGQSKKTNKPTLPRVKLVLKTQSTGRKWRRAPTEPPAPELDNSLGADSSEIEEVDLSADIIPEKVQTAKKLKLKELKVERDLKYVLTCLVMFGSKHILPEESSVEIVNRHSFDYQAFCSKESKEACLWSTRRKMDLERAQSRAMVRWGMEGKGATMSRSVNGPEDWEKAEAIAGEWAASNKKDVRIELKVEYRVPVEAGEEEELSDFDAYEEDISSTPGPATGGKRVRRTATVILQEEMEKKKKTETCWIPQLMEEWRCQNANCKQYRDGACLVLHDEGGCRPLNGYILGQWDAKIKKGEAAVKAFPSDIKPPPLAKEKKPTGAKLTSASASVTPVAVPPPMQISVSTPAPQIPWWLSHAPLASHISSSFPSLPSYKDYTTSPIPQPDSQFQFSSPVRSCGNVGNLLAEFIDWFEETQVGDSEENLQVLDEIAKAHSELKKAMYDLEGVRKMDSAGWKDMNVPVGLGRRMSTAVHGFINTRSKTK